jgi:hypothetical protein
MKLYDLSEQYNVLAEMLEVDTDNETLESMLNGINDVFDRKAENIIKLMQSKISEHTAIDAEAKRLKQRADKLAKEIDWLESYVENEMLRTGKDKVKSSIFNITLGLCPPSVNVLNESEIPAEYFNTKQVTTLDKRNVLEILKSGTVIPGCEISQRKTIRIK